MKTKFHKVSETDINLRSPPAKPIIWIATNKDTGDQVEVRQKLWYYAIQEASIILGCEPCQIKANPKQDTDLGQ